MPPEAKRFRCKAWGCGWSTDRKAGLAIHVGQRHDHGKPGQKARRGAVLRRSSAAEVEARVHEVVELVLQGVPRREVVRYAAENWKVASRQVDNYLARAREVIAVTAERSRDVNFGMAQERLNLLFYRAMRTSDCKTALAVVREMNKLHGLTTTRRFELEGAETPLAFDFSDMPQNKLDLLEDLLRSGAVTTG